MKTKNFTLKIIVLMTIAMLPLGVNGQIVMPNVIKADTIYVVEVDAEPSVNYGNYWEMKVTFMDSIVEFSDT